MKKNIITSIVVLLALIVLTGCGGSIGNKKVMYKGSNVGNKINGSYKLFSGAETKTIKVKKGKTVIIDYSSEVKKGELLIQIIDSNKNIVQLESNKAGTEELKAEKDENYILLITGVETEGNFNFKWDEPK